MTGAFESEGLAPIAFLAAQEAFVGRKQSSVRLLVELVPKVTIHSLPGRVGPRWKHRDSKMDSKKGQKDLSRSEN